ncbi:peptidoglycan-binding protein [Candidatus Nomurabacteria bacterium]|nr:peptidoglycan-binding protein [Candidatus Nomurabacteria bacterium]
MKNKIIFIVLFLLTISYASISSAYNFGDVTLKNGSRGEAVMELQRFLNDNLNLGLIVDGKLGPKTIMVIKKWQINNELKPDGLIGEKTKIKMNSITDSHQNAQNIIINDKLNFVSEVNKLSDPACLSSSTPSIKIISPAGGEVYKAGDTIKVSWVNCNIPKGDNEINVQLGYSGPSVMMASFGHNLVANSISDTIIIPLLFPYPSGNFYDIRVSALPESGAQNGEWVFSQSNKFRINGTIKNEIETTEVALSSN